jgi:CxxC-x17-CxxC domain-containing protein
MELPEIPLNKDITYLGLTSYRDQNTLFGIKRRDRRQHVYVLGKSGTGKSVLLFNMILQNIMNGEGVCVVDPHGELVESVVAAIPEHRVKDVIYFNPSDTDYHIGFNVLELVDPKYKHLVASGLMGIFTKIWANAWSARMEYILNNTILALLDTPGSTLLGVPRMLVDKDYRQKIITNLKDPVIKTFWVHEYEAWQDKFRNEAIAPIQNKVGQFLSTSIIRNVVGQTNSTINIFDIMNGGKIFLVNVSKGRIGEDNSALLGGMIITKIQLAAMERVRIPEDIRKDFYLYVDEFQNFVTEAFAGILSEARKYRLNLTVAHQYTAQLISDKSSAVRDAIFGNVGTMMVFRVGADDAEFLEKEFEPEFTPQDIVNLPNYKVYTKLMIDGITSRPFSAKTLPPMIKVKDTKVEEEVIRSSRELYCRPREVIEKEINDWSGMSLGDIVGVQKFDAVCSTCGNKTTVPFKPEPGRAVYCRECMEKIKAGTLKPVVDNSVGGIIYDDASFYQPLAELGIEFQQKGGAGEKRQAPRFEEVGEKKILSVVKKVFHRSGPAGKGHPNMRPKERTENFELREILSKASNEPVKKSTVSLDNLRSPAKEQGKRDLSATAQSMERLKSLIQDKKEAPVLPNDTRIPVPPAAPVQPARRPEPTPSVEAKAEPSLKPLREVPEEVLRKILE